MFEKMIQKKLGKMRHPLNCAKHYKKDKVRKNTVFYQAYRNKIMAGNPFAIFKELVEHPDYQHLTHYWAYENEASLNDDTFLRYKDYPNVIYVKSRSEEYFEALSSCEYLINNAALPSYWCKKKDQIYINTWHGTPLKTLGRKAKDRSLASVGNAQRNFFTADYLVMPNRYTIHRMEEAYDFENMLPGKIVDAGYPRVDLVLKADQKHIRGILEEKLGKSLEGKKIVLYAPTFRSVEGISQDTSGELGGYMTQLMEILPADYELVFKVHNMMAAFFKDNEGMKNRLIFDEIETNELLSVTDVLITDYSSIFFEYLCLKRPILFFVYDRKEYEGGRGLFRPLEEMPGALCETIEDLRREILSIDAGEYHYDEKFYPYLEEFAYNDDGHATKRVIDIIFGRKPGLEKYIYEEPVRDNILVLADDILIPEDRYNCLDVLRDLDYEKNSVMVMGRNVLSFAEDFEKIHPQIKLNSLARVYVVTLAEKIIYKMFKSFPGKKEFLKRQYDMAFGGLEFVKVIDASRHPSDWGEVLKSRVEDYTRCYPESIEAKREIRRAHGHGMKALFIGAFDSTNYLFVNLIKEFERRGYECLLIVNDPEDYVNNKMFIENEIPMIRLGDFDYEHLADIDFVLTTPFRRAKMGLLLSEIKKRGIFTVSFANLFSSVLMRMYADLIFTVGSSKFSEYEENGLHYSMVALGNPQYDDLVRGKIARGGRREEHSIRRVLFIDQGGYPFGSQGKQELANVLMAMAKKHPDKEFVVKPRFLPDDLDTRVLHKPSEHLYDFLPNPPSNLILQREATILEDILGDFDAMVTMWSTAFLDAALMDIPLMLIKGLPTEEVVDVRRQRVNDAYDRLELTGCVVDYHDVLDGTLQFGYVNEDFLREEVGDIKAPSAPRMVDTLEGIYEHLIIPQRRLAHTVQMDAGEFDEKLSSLPTIDAWGEEYSKRRELFSYFNELMQSLVFENRCMAMAFDMKPLMKYWDYQVNPKMTEEQMEALKSQMARDVEQVRTDYFSNPATARETDPIRLDFYLEWLYLKEDYDKIMGFDNPHVRPESLHFFKAMVEFKRGEITEGCEDFIRYYHIIQELQVKPLKRDRSMICEFLPLGMTAHDIFRELYRRKEYEMLKELADISRFNIYVRYYFLMRILKEEGKEEEIKERFQYFRYRAKPLLMPKEKAGEYKKLKYKYYIEIQRMAGIDAE